MSCMDFVCFSFLVFSPSSFVEKGAGEVNSLISCTSKNTFILFSHMIYTMDNLEVEIVFLEFQRSHSVIF